MLYKIKYKFPKIEAFLHNLFLNEIIIILGEGIPVGYSPVQFALKQSSQNTKVSARLLRVNSGTIAKKECNCFFCGETHILKFKKILQLISKFQPG